MCAFVAGSTTFCDGAHPLAHRAYTQRNAHKSIINASHTDAHNTERYVQEVPNLSRVGPTRGGLTTKQSPYAKHMRKAIASPMETRVVHSETRVTSCGGPAPDTKLAFYFVACCYRAINSGPHTLCMPTLLGELGG